MPPRSRNFVFTFNNYPDTTYVDNLVCKYIAYSKEVAPTTGTPHLQGYVSFCSAKTHDQAKKLLPGMWCSPMIGSLAENDIYCSKVESMTERGEKPISNDNKGRAEKMRWQRARDAAKKNLLDDIDADIYIRCYSTLKRIAKDHAIKPAPQDCIAVWIYGVTGMGKSHSVEIASGLNVYKKNMDILQWFDCYQGEECVYLEDISVFNVKWGDLLKRLADKWPMLACVKGSMQYIRPKYVVVTSNYRISDIWTDSRTVDPLLRRFREVEKLSVDQVIDFTQ